MTNRIQPVSFKWLPVDLVDGETGEARRIMAMVPLPRYDNVSKRQYHADEDYTLVPLEERSQASHNFYFAALKDAFDNLPEKIAARFPSQEHFRKWLLMECNYCDEHEIDCPDENYAKRLAKFIRPGDEYARISTHRPEGTGRWKVIVRRAKSQSRGAMKKAEFERSKKDVLDLAEHMTGVEPGTLMREAGRNA